MQETSLVFWSWGTSQGMGGSKFIKQLLGGDKHPFPTYVGVNKKVHQRFGCVWKCGWVIPTCWWSWFSPLKMAVFWVSAWILTNPGDLQCPRERKKSGELSLLSVLQLSRYSHGYTCYIMLLCTVRTRICNIIHAYITTLEVLGFVWGGSRAGIPGLCPPTLHRLNLISYV